MACEVKRRPVILCCLLLSTAGVSNGIMCLSNIECPYNDSLCIQNCSAVAIEFNLPASQGNCRISSAVGGGSDNSSVYTYGCYLDSCSTDFPDSCIASNTGDASLNLNTCCCTEDLCNVEFIDPPMTSLPADKTATHIYPTYPNHTTPEQLVCAYLDCNQGDGECITGFEVCEATDEPTKRHVCYALLISSSNNTMTILKSCFDDNHAECPKDCILKRHTVPDISIYDCCCIGNLCNLNINVNDIQTAVDQGPHSTISVIPNATVTTSNNNNNDDDTTTDNHALLICVITVGAFSLVVLTLTVIMMLAYCHFCWTKTGHPYQNMV